ncbi:MAG TPA: DedA family protein [Verrucomicrobiales bacterium]|nr:DedA family protein [Verrucomicrobiales bacterium]
MELIHLILDWVVHIDRHLGDLIHQFGPWFYVLMFVVIFCETGLVVTPILPGDSLLFAMGAFAANHDLSLPLILALVPSAAILGDLTNYSLGHWLGPRIFRGENVRLLNRKHLDRTREFYERHGSRTIIMARFVPIVRTFAPFVAGMGAMRFGRFVGFSLAAGLLWTALFVPAGYFFANNEFVRTRFSLVMLAIIVISALPALFEVLKARREKAG